MYNSEFVLIFLFANKIQTKNIKNLKKIINKIVTITDQYTYIYFMYIYILYLFIYLFIVNIFCVRYKFEMNSLLFF